MKIEKILKLIEAGISPEDIVKLNEVIEDDEPEAVPAADVPESGSDQGQKETDQDDTADGESDDDDEAEAPQEDEYKRKYEQLLKQTQKAARSEDLSNKLSKPQSDDDIINELTRSFMT